MLETITFTKLRDNAILPTRGHEGDAGLDLYTAKSEFFGAGEVILVPTGVAVTIPQRFEGQVRSRSGLAFKTGLIVHQGVGTIDYGYTGEIIVCLRNVSPCIASISEGDRIAQLIIAPIALPKAVWGDLPLNTARSVGGFGSTGK